MHTALLSTLASVALTAFVARADARSRPAPCHDAVYEIVGPAIGSDPHTGTTIELGAKSGLGDACPLTATVTQRANRRGETKIRARWESCPGFTGRVRFKGRIIEGCSRVIGTVSGPAGRGRVEAVRVDCGDGILDAVPPATPYAATTASLATHPLPPWFTNAKFGIMIHWGIFTIPAWAEEVIDPGEWLTGTRLIDPPDYGREFFTHIPYVEWYPNTMLIDGSPTQQHHIDTYGADYPYENFRPAFEAAATAWSGDAWADAFQASGARYVVLVTKHHDGFALWPTNVPHPTRPGWNMDRDIVGELNSAVRKRCMRMGLYYSGGFDWSVQPGPVETSLDALTVAPQTPEYVAYADGQWRELIARYDPAILWNDIGYPNDADELALFADFYNERPDGVVNDRFSLLSGFTHHDYITPEFSVLADISPKKFETVRGMGRGFGYNQNESDDELDTAEELIHLLIDVVSKNGNLLLNVGPRADGSIPDGQRQRLDAIGAWLGVNGAAIFGTVPWSRAAGVTSTATPVRFTTSADGATVYAIVMGPVAAGDITLVNVPAPAGGVRLLGTDDTLDATAVGSDLRITVPSAPAAQPAYVFALDQS